MGATYGDTFVQGDYTYTVEMPVLIIDDRPDKGFVSVQATNKTKSSYGGIPSLVTYNGETFYVQYLTECFKDCINLTTAPTLPDLVPESDPTYGGDNENAMDGCFSGCSKLTSISAFPRNATGLYNTFENCTSLTTPPTIPSNIRKLGETFKGCTSLASAPTIPSGVESMGGTFEGCTSLTSAPTIPSRVRWLDETFEGCTSLTSPPTIPSGVESMIGTFKGCTSLVSSPTIPSGVNMLDSCFEGCTSLKTPPSSIPNTVGQMTLCFKNCINLESTPPAIPATVTSIWSAFENCRKITSPPQIANGVVDMESTFSGCSSLNTFPSIPSSVLYLDNGFKDCTSLNSVPQIPSTVLWMEQCFSGCTSLEGIITLHNSPSKYSDIFKNTVEDIIIVVDSVTPWKSVANEYENVYLRCASATSAPTVAATSLRVDDGGTTESEMGEYAYITATPSIDTENWYGNQATMVLKIDGDPESTTWYDANGNTVTSMQTRQTYHTWVDIGDYLSHALSFVATDLANKVSSTVSITFPQVFALMSFKAGGTGVAVGTRAVDDNFTVALPANFVGNDTDNPTGLAVREQVVPPTFYYITKPAAADLPVRPCVVIQTSDWSMWYCDNEETPAYHRLNTDTNTTYSAGTGLALSGTTFRTTIPRVVKNANSIPGQNTVIFEEYNSGSNYNLPTNAWYHIITMEGNDPLYATQLALGMTTDAAYYRKYANGSWGGWISLVNTNTTYSAGGGLTLSGTTFNLRDAGNNTGDTWVPVWANGVLYHRVIPAVLNSAYWRNTTSALWGSVTSGTTMYFYQRGNVCQFVCNDFQIGSNTTIGQVPSGYRPADRVNVASSIGYKNIDAGVHSGGEIVDWGSSLNTSHWWSGTWAIA